MNDFIPYEKLSKKAKKEHDAKQRSNWNGVKPYTRIETSKKAYRRKPKHRQNPDD